MSNASDISTNPNFLDQSAELAIWQVIQTTPALDYIDVVNAVRDQFRMEVTSAQVENVYHKIEEGLLQPPTVRTSVSLTGSPRSDAQPSGLNRSAPELTLPAHSVPEPVEPQDDLAIALNFVKSLGGLANAKRALEELETILLGGKPGS